MNSGNQAPSAAEAAAEPEAGLGTGPSTLDEATIDLLVERLARSDRYEDVSPDELRGMVEAALRSRCIAASTSAGERGYLFWAAVTPAIDNRLASWGGRAEAMLLGDADWRGGENLWLLEVLAANGLAQGLAEAFARSAGGRPIRRARGVPVARTAPEPEATAPLFKAPPWIDSWHDPAFRLAGRRVDLRKLSPEDAEATTRWLSSDRMMNAFGSSQKLFTVDETRRLIYSAASRGQLLLAFTPRHREDPAGFFMVSPSHEPGVACLSFATGDRYRLLQEDVVDAASSLISWLFEQPGTEQVLTRVFGGNRVVVNWFRRFWPSDGISELQFGLATPVVEFRIAKEEWAAALTGLRAQHDARPWNRAKDPLHLE